VNRIKDIILVKKKGWVFILVVFILIGTPLLTIFVNFVYTSFFINEKSITIENSIILFPLIYFIYTTFLIVNKTSGFWKSTLSGLSVFAVQVIVFLSITIFFAMIAGLAPSFKKDQADLKSELIERYKDRYKILVSSADEILHSSRWSIGEEFGTDLIVKVSEEDFQRLSPNNMMYENLSEKKTELPFRFSNRQFLCSDGVMGSKIKIEDEVLRNIVCSDQPYEPDVLIAEKKVREDWTITTVIFPSKKVVWITETEW